MSITAVSADGVSHVFPDGTSTAVIGKVMKDYAVAHPPKSAGPKPGMLESMAAGAGEGMGKAALGTEQLAGEGLSGLGTLLGPVGGIDRWVGGKLQADANRGLTNIKGEAAPYQAAHPVATDIGQIAGSAPLAMAPVGAMGDLAPAATYGGRAAQALRAGTVVGAEQPIDPSKTGADYWKSKTEETGENIAGSLAFGQAGEAASGIGKWIKRNAPDLIPHKTARAIADAMAADEKAGQVKATDAIRLLNEAHQNNVPLTVMETGGKQIKKLAGRVYRGAGAGGSILDKSFTDRIGGARQRMMTATEDAFDAPESRRVVSGALSASQQAASKPLYDEAMKPGSVAPLEKQFEAAFSDVSRARREAHGVLADAKQQMTLASAKLARAGTNIYSNAKALADVKDAQKAVEGAHEGIVTADMQHQSHLARLRQAQQAQANGERGGVWSPHIARLIENPKVKVGIQKGLAILRDEADANNIPFNPKDYAIVGEDANKNPIVARVPNMRLLDAAKKGLDDMLEQYRDEKTGRLVLDEAGRQINALRLALLNEVDRINPAYKAARAAWAGPAAAKGAMKLGEGAIRNHAEDVKNVYDGLSTSEKEHFKIGAAQAYIDAISEGGVTAPVVRKIGEDDSASMAKRRLMPLFKSEAELDKFIAAIKGERSIHDAKTRITGGAQTAERLAEDSGPNLNTAIHATHAIGHAAHGNIPGFLRSSASAIRDFATGANNPELNEAIARSLTSGEAPGEVPPMPQRLSGIGTRVPAAVTAPVVGSVVQGANNDH